MIKIIKYILYSPIDFLNLIIGLKKFRKYTVNTYSTYKSMIRLFFIYGDIVLDFVNKYTKEQKNNISNIKTDKKKYLSEISENIKKDGFYVEKNFLSTDDIIELRKLIENYNFKLRLTDNNIQLGKTHNKFQSKFDPINPKAILYEFDINYLINQKIIQKILLKDEILIIGQKYFGSLAFFDHISLSITTNFNKLPDSNSAQLYHFDLDRPKWLKFLTYVNDVDFSNGPHCFIKKTHKNNAIPFSLRSKGYVRIDDQNKYIKNLIKNEIKITGKAGTAIIEDTKGLHKGSVVKKGYRILLNIQINSSMFGSPYNVWKFEHIHNEFIEEFKKKRDFFKYSTNLDQLIN